MDHKKSSIENKLFTFIITFTVLSLCIVPFFGSVSAAPVYIAVNNPSTDTYENTFYLVAQHPSATTPISAIGQSFIVQNTGYLESISVKLHKEGSPTGTLIMELYNATQDGSAWIPDTLKSTSETTFEAADLTHAGGGFTFAFDTHPLLSATENYAFYIRYNSTNYADGSNYVRPSVTTSNTYEGSYDYTAIRYKSSAWYDTTADFYFTVIGVDSEPTPTPTPDPEATATPAPVPTATANPQFTEIWDTLASLINLLVPLLCVVLPAFFGYKFAGAWGFMAGVNIGAILAYTILGSAVFPLWGIVALLIIDALLLFGKVGLHE